MEKEKDSGRQRERKLVFIYFASGWYYILSEKKIS